MKLVCILTILLATTLSSGYKSTDEIYTASWYGGSKFENKPMACGGIRFKSDNFSAAGSNIFKCGERIRVTNISNNRSVDVIILDRGNFKHLNGGRRVLDLSRGAFKEISPLSKGVIEIKIERLDLIEEKQ